MKKGFLRVNREFLLDGQTLMIAGLRDGEGKLLKTRTRVLPRDCDSQTLLDAYQEAFGKTKVDSLELPSDLTDNASRMWKGVALTPRDP